MAPTTNVRQSARIAKRSTGVTPKPSVTLPKSQKDLQKLVADLMAERDQFKNESLTAQKDREDLRAEMENKRREAAEKHQHLFNMGMELRNEHNVIVRQLELLQDERSTYMSAAKEEVREEMKKQQKEIENLSGKINDSTRHLANSNCNGSAGTQTFECGMCMEDYGTTPETTPRVLRCGHTYCNECLNTQKRQMKHSCIRCPICQKSSGVKKAEDLPKNYALLQ